MNKHRDNKNYSHWSLEKTAMLLSKASSYSRLPNHLIIFQAFPETFIALVRPSRMEKGTFSCYDNFVRSNSVGSPEHSTDHGALIHLSQLLVNLGLNPNTWSLTLVGFSKGRDEMYFIKLNLKQDWTLFKGQTLYQRVKQFFFPFQTDRQKDKETGSQ